MKPAREGLAEELPDGMSLAVMRRRIDQADVYRATWDKPGSPVDIGAARAVLQAPSLLPQWLPCVEGADMLEYLGASTHMCRVRFKLSWPASPRDAVVLTHVRHDATTLVYVMTSVPRHAHAPSYVRPAPPYVRAQVHIAAVVVHQASPTVPCSLTAYWCVDPHGFVLGVRPTAMLGAVPRMLPLLATWVQDYGHATAYVARYGHAIRVSSENLTGSTLRLTYTIVRADAPTDDTPALLPHSLLLRMAAAPGWDVTVTPPSPVPVTTLKRRDAWYELEVSHPAREDEAPTSLTLQVTCTEDAGVRVQGTALEPGVSELPEVPVRDALLQRLAATDTLSVASTAASETPRRLSVSPSAVMSPLAATVRRNYIYFASLLQEPEAKWTRVSDARGVTVTQLDSIDPTLVVYRAEATFVGLSVWDLYGALQSPSLGVQWQPALSRAELLRDLGGQSALWQLSYPASWPTSARDAVLVQTAYTGTKAVQVFSFSADDHGTEPPVPSSEPGTIRMQVDLYGWSLEALSPTAVHVTLLEQSDPRGWLSKSRTPALMTTAVAGLGEYVLRHGSPPLVSRLLNARIGRQHYDTPSDTFQLEYTPHRESEASTDTQSVECELRCHLDAWAPNIDVRVEPRPTTVSCLRRHQLSEQGGGLWLTVEHAADVVGAAPISVVIRKGPAAAAERGVVLLNGSRLHVDADDLDAEQVQALVHQKRVKPQHVPLDTALLSPVDTPGELRSPAAPRTPAPADGEAASAPADATGAADATGPAEPAAPAEAAPDAAQAPAPAHSPMEAALQALFLLRRINADRHPDPAGALAGWTLVSERRGLYVRRRMMESLSSTTAVHRADKVIPGIAAEDLLRQVSRPSARQAWDDQLSALQPLESYGDGAGTALWTAPASFPFQGRAFVVSSITAHGRAGASEGGLASPTWQPVYFHASASCAAAGYESELTRLGADKLTRGRVLIDGWIFETIDPYSTAQYPIPSTRCTYVVAVDYSGLTAGVNALWNAALPYAVLQLERAAIDKDKLPYISAPPSWHRVRGDDRDENAALAWVRGTTPRTSTLLQCDYDGDTKTLSVLTRCQRRPTAPPPSAPPPPALTPARAHVASPPPTTTPAPSPAAHSAPSPGSHAKRVRDAAAADVVAEAHVELQHYPHGYAVRVLWEPAQGVCDLRADPARRPDDALPLQVHILDLPPSALQLATHATAERPHCHGVRVTLPHDRAAPAADAAQHTAALVRVSISPLPARADASKAPVPAPVPVTLNGRVAEIAYGADAKRHGALPAAAELLRLPEDERPRTRTGWSYERGHDVLSRVLASVVRAPTPSDTAPSSAAPPATSSGPAAHAAPAAPSAAASAPLFGLLRTQRRGPLRYAGLGSLVARATNPTGAAGSGGGGAAARTADAATAGPATAPEGSAPPSTPPHEKAKSKSKEDGSAEGSLPGSLTAEAGAARERTARASASRALVTVLLMVMAFLAGSLARSLLEPVDYILEPLAVPTATQPSMPTAAEPPPQAAAEAASASASAVSTEMRGLLNLATREVDSFLRAALQLHTLSRLAAPPAWDTTRPLDPAPPVRRREFGRFLDMRLPGIRWHLVVGWARAEDARAP